MKKVNEITPEVREQLKTIAESLPIICKTSKNGNVLYKKIVTKVNWEDLTEDEKKRFPAASKKVRYIRTVNEPIRVNHFNEMYFVYKKHGDAGIDVYVRAVNEITEQSILAAQQVSEVSNELTSGSDAQV